MQLYRETKGVVTQNAIVLNAGYAFKGFFSWLTLYMYNGSQRMNESQTFGMKGQKTYVTKRNDTSVKMFLTEIKVWLTCEVFFVLTNSCLKVPSTQVTLFPCVQNLTKVKIKLFLNKLFHILYFVINIS